MKRATMLFAIAACAWAGSAAAQGANLQLGVMGGAAITTITGSDTEDAESRTSAFFGGVLVLHKAGAAVGFETGALYVPKGASTTIEGVKAALEITYVEIPVLLRLALPLQNASVTPVIMLGGSLGLKTGCKVTAESGSTSAEVDCDDSSFEGQLDLKSMDIGLTGGAAVDIPIGSRAVLSPAVRYVRGISDIGDTADNADAKNSAFQVGVAVRFTL